MSSSRGGPTDNNTSTQYLKHFYWCVNNRGTLYVLPFDGRLPPGTLQANARRLGRLKSVNWTGTKVIGGSRIPALILGVESEESPVAAQESQGLNDSFDVPPASPSYFLLDEKQFYGFEDHPDGGDSWAQSEVLTAAFNLLDKTPNGIKKDKGKWLKDIFKGDNQMSLTDPRTPIFEVPPNNRDLQDEVVSVQNLNVLFREGARLIVVGILVVRISTIA